MLSGAMFFNLSERMLAFSCSVDGLPLQQHLGDNGGRSEAFLILAWARRNLNCARHLVNNVGLVCS
jgi:hypothetical protein